MLGQLTAASTPLQHARHASPRTHAAVALPPRRTRRQRRRRLSYKLAAVHVDAELLQHTPAVLAARLAQLRGSSPS